MNPSAIFFSCDGSPGGRRLPRACDETSLRERGKRVPMRQICIAPSLVSLLSIITCSGWFALAGAFSPGARAAEGGQPTVAARLGHPANARLLIVHADDLGGMRTINRATFEALE